MTQTFLFFLVILMQTAVPKTQDAGESYVPSGALYLVSQGCLRRIAPDNSMQIVARHLPDTVSCVAFQSVASPSVKSVKRASVQQPLPLSSIERKTGTTIRGEEAKAFLTAYSAFAKISDLAENKKRMENYTVEISKDKVYFYVHFHPLPSRSFSRRGGENEFGREALYKIRRVDYKVVKRTYYR